MRRRKNATLSRTSPRGGKRGCLCPDGKTYSSKCCDGTLEAQGIGNITGEVVDGVVNSYVIESCSDQHRHNAHLHTYELTVGKVYYLTLENHHDECYTIISTSGSEGIHINTFSTQYLDCATCTAAN